MYDVCVHGLKQIPNAISPHSFVDICLFRLCVAVSVGRAGKGWRRKVSGASKGGGRERGSGVWGAGCGEGGGGCMLRRWAKW